MDKEPDEARFAARVISTLYTFPVMVSHLAGFLHRPLIKVRIR